MSSKRERRRRSYATPSPKARRALEIHATAVADLPDPGEEVLFESLIEDLSYSVAYRFRACGVIKKTRTVAYDDEYPNKKGHLWTTRENAHKWARKHVNPDTTPCGNATGVRCVESGEVYTCTSDDCDCRMDRETAEEVVA